MSTSGCASRSTRPLTEPRLLEEIRHGSCPARTTTHTSQGSAEYAALVLGTMPANVTQVAIAWLAQVPVVTP